MLAATRKLGSAERFFCGISGLMPLFPVGYGLFSRQLEDQCFSLSVSLSEVKLLVVIGAF